MKNLSIRLNQDYRSFKNGFGMSFNGDLVILSGVNGSGKSQLMDIISQRDNYRGKKSISAIIKLDDIQITRNDILCRSFKENINVPELTYAGTESINDYKNKVWNAYHNYRLDSNNENLWDYKESSEGAKKILQAKFGEQKFNSGQITQIEIKDTLPPDFVWKLDDIFTNFIGDLFFNYALDVYDGKAKAWGTHTEFILSSLPTPPWKQLNKLFFDQKFEYRFKDDYFINKGFQINEQPSLYQIKNDGAIDENEPRKLTDLSDGEKAIISLSFASLSGVKQEDRKVLLLDEFDATFNPSFTEIFYNILNKYFIEQGILVIIATHSPTTISLAPDSATFYEIFKQKTGSSRILLVQKDDYAELQVANKVFYTRIANQTLRIAELEQEKAELDELQKVTKPSLFVEGDIDIQYLNKATEFCVEWKLILDRVSVKEKNGKGGLSKYWKNRLQIREFLKQPLILLFDCDTNQNNEDDSHIYKHCIPVQSVNSIKSGIENLFTDSLIHKAETSGGKYTQKSIPDTENVEEIWSVIDGKKKALADWICVNAEKDDFKNFEVIFDIIEKILGLVEENSETPQS